VLTRGGGVDRLVVRWQGEAMMRRVSVGKTMMASKMIGVILGFGDHGQNSGDSGASSSSFASLLPSSPWLSVVCRLPQSGSGVDKRGLGHRIRAFIARAWQWRVAKGGKGQRGYM
jgi:hypothetical protein